MEPDVPCRVLSILAGRLAVSTSTGLDNVVSEINSGQSSNYGILVPAERFELSNTCF